ncbi:MAG: sugar phosphate isomerase/epimerase family protein [Cytophagales bacterium]|nr:sugar phosphate isomerase/epimerase [Bernardetiaceae bacterium]MDW8205210.1 sugar phosphate isomerase/epimerase family protein [Cytophagales bacterium]
MQRRKFIQLAAVGSASFSWLFTYSSPKQLVLKKSLKYSMIGEGTSIIEKFAIAQKAGFDGVEPDSRLSWKEVAYAARATGLAIPGIVCWEHWHSPLSHPERAVRERCLEAMREALEACRQLGGSTVLLVPAVVNEQITYQEAYQRSQAAIRELLPLAERLQVSIAIENVWNNFLLSPLEAARYIDELNSPQVGWYFDVGNIIRYGFAEQWIRILGKRILKIDVKEYSRKMAEEQGIWKGFEAELLTGDCNWKAVKTALVEVGYAGGWMSAELRGGNLERLTAISQQLDAINRL